MAKFHPSPTLPAPAATQAIVKRSDCNGSYYSLRRARHRSPKRDGAAWWVRYMGYPIAWLNRRITSGLARAYRNILTQAQRDAWEALAPTATWTNYDGSPGLQNGFSVFMAVNRFRRYSNFHPGLFGAALFTPMEEISGMTILNPQANPPATWAQPPKPVASLIWVFEGWDAYFELENPPNPFQLIMTSVATVPTYRNCPDPPRRYINVQNINIINDFESSVDVVFDYPNPAETGRPRPRFGLRYTNFVTGNFSEPLWI